VDWKYSPLAHRTQYSLNVDYQRNWMMTLHLQQNFAVKNQLVEYLIYSFLDRSHFGLWFQDSMDSHPVYRGSSLERH
jgi:hypothetical protein